MCPPILNPPPHLPPHPIPLDCPRASTLSALLHASNLHWSSILHVVINVFQCYSLKSSHPRLLPQSLKVCSLHLCLFCCLAYRVTITVFLNSIYMHSYTVLVFLFLSYFTLNNRLQFHPPSLDYFYGTFILDFFGQSFDLCGSQTVFGISQDLPMCVHASVS